MYDAACEEKSLVYGTHMHLYHVFVGYYYTPAKN